MTEELRVSRMACARIPTDVGEFMLCLYHNTHDDKEHLALIAGEMGDEPPLVRLHSECFTGDVLGSQRCDCGAQLAEALRLVAEEGRGIILYLRQEGRGIGLLDKLRAYNLQDAGFDTVDANLLLGHQADLRDYRVAAEMLKDLGVSRLRLMTNNPDKIAGLERRGLVVTERIPLEMAVHAENAYYLDTKARRMRHLLAVAAPGGAHSGELSPVTEDDAWLATPPGSRSRPFVTLSYAQSLDGSIAARRGEPTIISGPEALRLTHQLRARHDAILVGIGTVLADDPRLTVRHVHGPDPQPVVLDSRLRFPAWARLLHGERRPWILTTAAADPARQAELEAAGARVVRLPAGPGGMVSLPATLDYLGQAQLRSVMIEGGATVIGRVLEERLADRLVLTIAPLVLHGLNPDLSGLGEAVDLRANGHGLPRLARPRYRVVGRDVVLISDLN